MLEEIKASDEYRNYLFNYYLGIINVDTNFNKLTFREKLDVSTVYFNEIEGFQLFVDFKTEKIYIYDNKGVPSIKTLSEKKFNKEVLEFFIQL